ncbi:MAG TPA: hypothetical protein VFJ16_24375 [Longimicrobium sp.]|nr:hypothetical protein [Longimicrobium sp.]
MAGAATKIEAERRSREYVDRWAKANLFTGWIPGASFALAAADMVMIRQVADAFGVEAFDEESLKVHLGGVLGSVTGAVAAEAIGVIPIVGWAVKAVTLHVKADTIGKAVVDYFRKHSTLPDA